MKRIILVAIITLLCISCHQKDMSGGEHKNVLLIMADDLNTDLGCFGNRIVRSPNIDMLAGQGVLFTSAYCQYPLCNPSRASLLTGLRPDHCGVTNLKARFRDSVPEVITLPQLFRQHGYFTARVGKVYHMGVPDAIATCSPGKDDPLSWDVAVNCIGYELNSNGVFYNATPWESDRAGTGGAVSWLKAEKGDELQHDHKVATEVIRLLEENQDKPFFMAAGFIRPHVPLVAPKRYFEMYDPDSIRLPDAKVDDWDDIPGVMKRIFGANFNITPEEHRNAILAYYACISFVDDQVGRIMNKLDEMDLRHNTLIVFISDHGYQLGEHGLWFKKFLFRESVNAPLIISDPQHKNTHGSKSGRVVEFVDLYPTVIELCNIDSPGNLDGISMVPLLNDPEQSWSKPAFIQINQGDEFQGRSVRTGRWCYNEWNEGELGTELYDLLSDPNEFNNLSASQEYADTIAMLKKLLYQNK